MSLRPTLRRWGLVVAAVLSMPHAVTAQSVRIGGAVLSAGGEVSGSLSEKTFDLFNHTEYERSLLRLFRMRLATDLRVGRHVSLLVRKGAHGARAAVGAPGPLQRAPESTRRLCVGAQWRSRGQWLAC